MGSNDLNYGLVSNKTLSQKIGSLVWCPGPDDLGQNAWTYPHYDVTHKKTKTLTFPIRLPASLEGLNSSLTQSVGELWLCKVHQKSGACGTKRVKV